MPNACIARSANRVQSLHEINAVGFIVGRRRHVERHPTHLVRIRRQLIPVAGQMRGHWRAIVGLRIAERPVHGRRPNAIQPGASVRGARRRERGARQLLGVQPVGALLRRVLGDGQSVRVVRMGGREMGAEAAQVLRAVGISGVSSIKIIGVGLSPYIRSLSDKDSAKSRTAKQSRRTDCTLQTLTTNWIAGWAHTC